jgi:hypothetical protein
MTKERELLRRTLELWDNEIVDFNDCMEDIRTFLAVEPEAEPLVNNKSLLEMIEEIPRRIEPLGGQRYSYVRLEEVKYVIDEFVARHPPRPAETEAEYDFYGVIPLTHRKAKGIIKDRGYHVTGFVLSRPDGDKCIVDMSAVRWLSGKEFFEMMHPPVVSPTAEPEAEPVAWIYKDFDKDNAFASTTKLTDISNNTQVIPLYTRPQPARKPLSDEEIADAFYTSTKVVDSQLAAYKVAKEKHHGIGGDDDKQG